MNKQCKKPFVSVVIPFFQRDKGLLEKCVSSILQQQDYENFQVIVVDDGSPVSAAQELEELLQATVKVRVLEQENAGPGAARNRGLDNLPAETQYVAFMDSDDWWEETFLSDAVAALELGHDLFFANSQRFGFEDTRFDWKADKGLQLVPSQHQLQDQQRQLYRFEGHFFDYAIVRSNIISTSAMVYRLSCNPQLRFSTELFNGQDRLFKLALSQVIDKVAFCPRVLVQEGQGVNIFDSSRWGTAKSLVLTSNYIRLSKCILRELSLSADNKKIVKNQLGENRLTLVASLLHLLNGGVKIDWNIIRSVLKADILFFLYVIPMVFRIAQKKHY